jgi:hypothetical protein
MKTKLIVRVLYTFCVGAILTLCSEAFAQAPTAYKPGDTLSFTVRFEGDGIDRLAGAQVNLVLTSPIHDDQKNFLTYINANAGSAAKPGIFEATIKIPDFVASGTYTLRQVSTSTAYVGFTYKDDFPPITITVENKENFSQPKLKGIEITSKP